MNVTKSETKSVRGPDDIVRIRQAVKQWAEELGLSLLDRTKVVTAASELARNTVDYGGGGDVRLEIVDNGLHRGLRLTFEDAGPGIADVERALADGYTSGHGLGLGLGGARRLVNEFAIESQLGRGTRVTVVRWK